MKRFLTYFFLVILLLPLVLELGLRATSSNKLRRFKRAQYQVDSILGYRYKPNSKGQKVSAAFINKYEINSDGFNWEEFPKVVSKDKFRILFIGDSDETGIESNGVNSYVRLLQKKFRENGDKIEILNFSTDGKYREVFKMDFVYRIVEKYSPDLVFFKGSLQISSRKEYRTTYKGIQISYFNEERPLDRVKKMIDKRILNPVQIKEFYKYSYTYRFLCKYYIERNSNDTFHRFLSKSVFKNTSEKVVRGYVRNRVTLNKSSLKKYTVDETLEFYKKSIDSIKSLGSNLYLFSPYKDESINKILENYNENNLDPLSYLSIGIDRNPKHYFGKLDGHSNQFAHKLIYEKMYRKLFLKNIIPKKYFSEKALLEMNINSKKLSN